MNEQALVAKVWNYAHVLRDDGVSFGDYIGRSASCSSSRWTRSAARTWASPLPCRRTAAGQTLEVRSGEALERHYKSVLEQLSRRDDLVGTLFLKAESKIGDPAKLQRLVGLIGAETWMGQSIDVKGTIYEGLLERNAGEVKSGAGQYFTPRPLIDAIVAVVDPEPGDTVHDPAVGYRRVSSVGLRAHAGETRRPRQARRQGAARGNTVGHRHRLRGGAALRDEPLPSRHRAARPLRWRRRTRCSTEAQRATASS